MAADEIHGRRQCLAAAFAALKLDALVVTFGPNLRYLTGFTGSNGLLLVLRDGDALFLTDPRYRIQSAREVTCRVQVCLGHLMPQMIRAAARAGVHKLGYDPAQMSCSQYESLRSELPPGVRLMPASGWVERQRMVKSETEIALIRRSVQTNSAAFEQAVRHARAGIRESDLAAELDYRMRRHGAEKPAFDTIVATGERSALPHAQPGAARIGPGHLVVVDMGALQDGYSSDMTRMLYAGRPDGKVKRLYKAVLDAQLAALAAVRPGVTAGHIDRAARQVLRAEKLDKAFVHSTGHGLGLEIHEQPRLGKKEKTRLQAGMAITIEPGVYLEGFGGIRIEDTVVVTRAGCEVLTPTPKELRII
jgi:Xaa-Pro aminopeptidase